MIAMRCKLSIFCALVFILTSSLQGCIKLKKTGLDNWDRSLGLVQRTDITDKKTKKATEALMSKGVEIVSVGQDYQIKLPSKMVFAYRSPNVVWQSYPLLNEIADYIDLFRIVNLYVENFVDEDGSNARNYALAKARARVLGDYLSSKTHNARIIIARGYNQTVEKEKGQVTGGSEPSDLVISFRNQIV